MSEDTSKKLIDYFNGKFKMLFDMMQAVQHEQARQSVILGAAVKDVGDAVNKVDAKVDKKTDQIINGIIPQMEQATAQQLQLDEQKDTLHLHSLRLKMLEQGHA